MAFSAPDLITDLSTTAYRAQLNANFLKIENALIEIQNELPLVAPIAFAANLSWIEKAIRSGGVIGRDSFVVSFSTDDELVITHDLPDGYSAAVINNRFHQTDAVFTKALSDVCTIDGDYTLIFGLKSLGAPTTEMRLVVEDTDQDIDLPVWRFNVTRASDVYLVSNLHRVCDIVMSRQGFEDLHDFPHPLSWSYAGALPTSEGEFSTGFVVPWDCEVEGAYMRLATGPHHTDGLTVDLYVGGPGTDAISVLSAPASWSATDDGVVVTCSPVSERVQVLAGGFIYPYLVLADDSGTAANLSITLLLKRVYHTLY